MVTTTRRNRLVPDSAVVVVVIAGLLMGLAVVCCCLGEHSAVPHSAVPLPGRSSAAGVVASDSPSDSVSDLGLSDDPADQDADRPGDGCGHPADNPAAVVASGGSVARDLAAGTLIDGYLPEPALRQPHSTVGGVVARAPASHLLCIMRT